jgi:hypothetical protein
VILLFIFSLNYSFLSSDSSSERLLYTNIYSHTDFDRTDRAFPYEQGVLSVERLYSQSPCELPPVRLLMTPRKISRNKSTVHGINYHLTRVEDVRIVLPLFLVTRRFLGQVLR